MVIAQFNLDMDGRKVADDVREKVAAIRPQLRDEVKEARVTRFDPASRPIYSLALTSPDGSRSQQELTTFADQVVRKRLENVRGVGSVTLIGARKREINIYLRPAAMDGFGIGVEQVLAAVRAENLELPAGTLRARDTEKALKVDARIQRPRTSRRSSSRAAMARRCAWASWPTSSTAPRRSTTWRCWTASARWCWTCASRRARTRSRGWTASMRSSRS